MLFTCLNSRVKHAGSFPDRRWSATVPGKRVNKSVKGFEGRMKVGRKVGQSLTRVLGRGILLVLQALDPKPFVQGCPAASFKGFR